MASSIYFNRANSRIIRPFENPFKELIFRISVAQIKGQTKSQGSL